MALFSSFNSRLLWLPFILAVTLTVLSNLLIISRMLIIRSFHASLASQAEIPQDTMKPLEKNVDTVAGAQQSGRHSKAHMLGGVFLDQKLLSSHRVLQPGTLEEAVARKFMSVRRYEIVNSHDYEYQINPTDACMDKKVEVLLCVVTAVSHAGIRSKFRYTIKGGYAGIWNEANKAVLLFFLGAPRGDKTASLQENVNNESREFGDIVQATFVDTYRNLSIKTMSILKWVSLYCAHASFVIKTDDDCDVNIPLMVTELRKTQHELPLFILGKVSRKLNPVRIKHSKWYIPMSVYKEDKYPLFMYGGSQGYPTEVARLLYEATLRIPTFFLEDVYISGLCANLLNIPRLDNKAFYFSHFPPSGETEY